MPEEVRADLLLGRDTLSPGLVKAGKAASDASSNVRQLTRDLYEAGKTRATPVVDLNDADATAKLEDVSAKLKELGAKVADPNVNLEDKEAKAGITAMQVKLDDLGRKVSSPRVTLDGLARAEAGIAALDLQLDRLSRKHATPDVTVSTSKGILSRLGGLFGGGGGAAGGAASAGGSLAGGTFTGPAIGIGAALAAALFPALVPLGLGGLVGGGAAGGALLLGNQAAKQLAALNKQLASSSLKGKQRAAVEAQVKELQRTSGPQIALAGAFSNFGDIAKTVFGGALTSKSQGFSGGPQGHPGTSFFGGITDILKQLGGFVKGIGPQLGDLFRASLPFVQAFVKILEQFAKAVLPSMTQSLKLLQPDLPILIQGFKYLSEGIAGFIKNLGPGMRDSAVIFKGAMLVVKGFLQLAGLAASDFAKVIVDTGRGIRDFARNVPGWFDKMRHETAVIFDGVRHDIAHIWDLIFNNTIGRADRGLHDIAHEFDVWRHDVASIFDAFKHDVAAVWDTIWNNTEGREIRGIRDVVGWFGKLPGQVLGALRGLGHSLYSFAHAALTDFLDGLKAVGGTILSWVGGLWHNIVGAAKKILGVFSPSKVFYDIGKNLMVGLFHGIRDHASHAVNAAAGAAGAVSGSAGAAQSYARRLAGAYGWAGQWADINAVAMRESGWSLIARNQSSGAYGIAQFIGGPSEYYQYGGNPNTVAGQVTAFFNYIRQRYGNPAAAWGHELQYGWYDQGGWLKPGLTLAYNATGRPEQVIPSSGRGGGTGQPVNVYVTVGHGTHPVQAAQEIAKILNAGAHSGVRLRTSILGPG